MSEFKSIDYYNALEAFAAEKLNEGNESFRNLLETSRSNKENCIKLMEQHSNERKPL